jgi:hypothetical protein
VKAGEGLEGFVSLAKEGSVTVVGDLVNEEVATFAISLEALEDRVRSRVF